MLRAICGTRIAIRTLGCWGWRAYQSARVCWKMVCVLLEVVTTSSLSGASVFSSLRMIPSLPSTTASNWKVVGALQVFAPSNQRALVYLDTHEVDAAIIDYHLADGTCVPVLGALIARHIPFIVVSGDTFGANDIPPMRRYSQN